MTRLIKWVLLLTVIGLTIFFAPSLKGQQGYILVAIGNYTLEGSIFEFAALILVVALTAYLIWQLVRYLIVFVILPSKWLNNRSDKTHANYFQSGLDFMTAGQWQQATEQFLKVKRLSRIQTAQQLATVCAVRAQDSELLANVQSKVEASDSDSLTSLIVLCQQQDYVKAGEVLNALDMNLLKQGTAFKQIWLEVQLHNFNWNEVKKHLPKINKQVAKEALDNAQVQQEWDDLLSTHFSQSFDSFVRKNSVNQLVNVWQDLGKNVQHIGSVSKAYIEVLSEQNQVKQIEQVLLQEEKSNDEVWLVDNLRTCYSNIKRVHMDQVFTLVHKKLSKQGDIENQNKSLLTAYAYLAAGQKDNQLAKQALEQVIYTNNNAQDSILYANVLAELGEVRHSLDVYQKLY